MDRARYTKILIGLGVFAFILIARLFYIQIINDRYKTDALNNSIVYETIYPPRGLIYDRDSSILVGNRSCYDILVCPREIRNLDTLALCEVLGIERAFLEEKLDYYRKYRSKIGFKTLPFLKNVDEQTYMRFCEVQYRFPGWHSQVRTTRNYPFNAGGNLLGYVSEVNADDLARNPEYRSGDYIGRTGLEAVRDKQLRGEKGYHIYLRDSRNRVLTSYNEGRDDKLARPGEDLVSTIDADLQQYGQELMRNKKGSVIAIEPKTGEILSLVTSPGIDVDILADMGGNYDALSKDPNKPMFNRAVQASYPPGSVFKLVNGLIGLEEGVLSPQQCYPCQRGYYYTPTKKLGCHKHPSPIDFREAVMMSCNSYFCYVFKNLLENPRYASCADAFDAWELYVRSFGFGSPVGCEIPNELGGNIPNSSYYDRIYGKGHWKYSSVISLAIGQGELGVTPLQIANLSATIANRGWYISPHLIKDSPAQFHRTLVDSSRFEPLIDGMYRAVHSSAEEGGTARLAAVKGLDICGKTGTAENPHGEDHSVFICFAPREDPQIAVAVYVENAGFGASWACPIASLMVEKYLRGEISKERHWLETYVRDADLMDVKKKEKNAQ